MKTAIVWHRRDLRVRDNLALQQAELTADRVIPVFVFDSQFWSKTHYSPRRLDFLLKSLLDLESQYQQLGTELVYLYGEPLSRLNQIAKQLEAPVYFNKDTNGKYGMQRDKSAIEEFGFIGLNNDAIQREGRSDNWHVCAKKYFETNIISSPERLNKHGIKSEKSPAEMRQKYMIPEFQSEIVNPGSSGAQQRLSDFLLILKDYPKSISKPLAAEAGTSRLSAHFSFGTISTREAYQKIKQSEAKQKSFYHTRLFWNQHFTQKLNDNPQLDTEAANPVFEQNYNLIYQQKDDLISAWQQGKTGYPLIDASMRALNQTGVINFRMRAMVASFFTYVMKQPWKIGADYMFQQLTDADRAINYAQWQMQSGLVGVHPNRIYNPTKQISDNDPKCEFIKKYMPELQEFTAAEISIDPEARSGSLFGEFYITPAVSFTRESAAARQIYHYLNKEAFNLVQKDKDLKRRLSLAGVAKKRTHKKQQPETKIV